MLAALGCEVVHLPRVEDEAAAIRSRIADGLASADGVVLTGGSSVGARDHVPAAIAALGPPGVVVHGLRVKPGKPTVFGAVGARPVIGLPGNPTSALTILDAIASDLVRALTGERVARRATVAARAGARFAGRPGWTWYVPALLEDGLASPMTLHSSHTSLLARADGYVVVGPEHVPIEPGEPVRPRSLRRCGMRAAVVLAAALLPLLAACGSNGDQQVKAPEPFGTRAATAVLKDGLDLGGRQSRGHQRRSRLGDDARRRRPRRRRHPARLGAHAVRAGEGARRRARTCAASSRSSTPWP